MKIDDQALMAQKSKKHYIVGSTNVIHNVFIRSVENCDSSDDFNHLLGKCRFCRHDLLPEKTL